MPNIKIVIADDYEVYRDGLKVGLSADENLEVIGEAENGAALLQLLETVTPDIIMMDLKMPVMDGIEATKAVRKKYPLVKVLVVTMYDDDKFIIHMLENGANGYLLKNADPEEIRQSIYAVQENGYYFNDVVSKALLRRLIRKEHLNPSFNQDVKLTGTELEVLQLICEEKTTAEIAEYLLITIPAIEDIRQQLIKKTGAKNTAGLVLFALKNDLVD